MRSNVEEASRSRLSPSLTAPDVVAVREKVTEEAWVAARSFFEENKYNPWILIAGADVHYEFQQSITRLHLARMNVSAESLPSLFDAFANQFNLELRRLIIEYKDGEIAALRRGTPSDPL
jgi:hypothetical protein